MGKAEVPLGRTGDFAFPGEVEFGGFEPLEMVERRLMLEPDGAKGTVVGPDEGSDGTLILRSGGNEGLAMTTRSSHVL